jgi:3-deoxy-manno-octulosonate cytidylyltransferase (CMP-KDO synthetase)
MTGDFVVVIPARYASTRLPGKALADIAGRPMIEWVYRRACASGAREVIVATDDERIAAAARSFGARAELTAATHASGTDRIAEVAQRLAWSPRQIVVNVQGDEPLIAPALIAQTARLLGSRPQAAIATLMAPLGSAAQFRDPGFAKVVLDRAGWALYFSRAPIPWPREGEPAAARRHIGLYAYRAADLRTLTTAGPCALEETERLEQLRALWLGLKIAVEEAVAAATPHVDTPEDLVNIRAHIARHGSRVDAP